MYSEKCPRCWGIIEYEEHCESVKCPYCGDCVLIADFVSKRVELEESKKKYEQAEIELDAKNEQLEALNKQKEQLQAKLNNSHSALSAILSSQEESEEKLSEMLTAMVTEKAEHEAMTELLHAVRSDQKAGNDTLAHLLQVLTRSQESTEGKLNVLKETAGKILNAQNSIQDIIMLQQDVMMQLNALRLDGAEQVTLLRDFLNWSSSIHEEDTKQLRQIQNAAGALLESQHQLLESQNQLQKKADNILNNIAETKSSVDSFRQAWDTEKLDQLNMLYKLANDRMFDRNFDKAEESYRKVLVQGGEDAEVYWRLILCHYCVEYQKDEDNRYIPIILNPDLSDPDTMRDRQNLFSIAKKRGTLQEYERKTNEIDRILNKYREVRHSVKYDVFISVKQNYEGHYTADSDKASDLYDELCKMGLRVFNSRRTPIPLGEEFEPYIISALMSSKVLVVIGSSAAFLESQWVKNEWSRFQWMQRYEKSTKGSTDRVLFCYLTGNMNPGAIPRALNPDQQAIKESPSALSKIKETLQRIFPEKLGNKKPSQPQTQNDLTQILSQMEFWLAMEQYEDVQQKHSSLISSGQHLSVAAIHLYALCAQLRIPELEQLKHADVDLEKERLFRFAMKHNQDDKLRGQMEEWLQTNRSRRQPPKVEQKKPEPIKAAHAPVESPADKVKTHVYPDGRIYKDNVTDGSGTIIWPNGARYEGTLVHGMRSGHGKMEMADGCTYNGIWIGDQKNFNGVYTWPDGQRYEGAFRNDKRHGQGVMTWPKGARYDGEWQNNVRHGKATFREQSGNEYHTVWEKGKLISYTRLNAVPQYPDGRVFKDNITEGSGIITWPDGAQYVGNLQNGMRSGKGRMNHPRGHEYIGDWLNDKAHGKGLSIWAEGNRYEGDYRNGLYNGKGKHQYADGRVYEGEWKDSMRHGSGVLTWRNGDVYKGEWRDNQYHGKGELTFADGRMYNGNWKDNKKHGYGVFTWPDGQRYDGEWQNDMRHGKAIYTNAAGKVFDTVWKNDEQTFSAGWKPNFQMHKFQDGRAYKDNITDGSGVITWLSGDQYVGNILQGARSGKGMMRLSDGREYTGDWLNDQFHGHGIYAWPGGDRFDGEWQNGQRVKGVWTLADGRKYDGQWKDNNRHGHGVFTWPNGDRFDGEWQNGQRVKGKLTLADGRVYTGDWLNDQFHGHGQYIWTNGNRFDGEWQNGQRVKGVWTLADGRKYDGQWKGDTRHGYGVFTWPNGQRYEGQWENSNYNGKGKMTMADGRVYDGNWKDDKKHGHGVFTWPNGERYDGEWQNDMRHGKAIYTNADGKVFDTVWRDDQKISSIGRSSANANEAKSSKPADTGSFDEALTIFIRALGNKPIQSEQLLAFCRVCDAHTRWNISMREAEQRLDGIYKACGISQQDINASKRVVTKYRIDNYATYLRNLEAHYKSLKQERMNISQIEAFIQIYELEKNFKIDVMTVEKDLRDIYAKKTGIIKETPRKTVSSSSSAAKPTAQQASKPANIWSYEDAMKAFIRALGNKPIQNEQFQAFYNVCDAYSRWNISLPEAEKRLERIYETMGIKSGGLKTGIFRSKYRIDNQDKYMLNLRAHYHSLNRKMMTDQQIRSFISAYELDKKLKIDVQTVKMDLQEFRSDSI